MFILKVIIIIRLLDFKFLWWYYKTFINQVIRKVENNLLVEKRSTIYMMIFATWYTINILKCQMFL